MLNAHALSPVFTNHHLKKGSEYWYDCLSRYDWNLLSTATPAIDAWLSPLDRLLESARSLARELTHRNNSVMACIMTTALEKGSIHMPYKV
ncbi:hypothetical protein DPMN_103035 [Dreissena polymorpha]|uniref:Bridge-like lipid transfer protein family member 1 middle region domain-containing protein n=1 Tax=Dreissena polymorpha TaxID=45954 RepID=A0A9D4JZR4_DREPO|nr:hypothetical protein DPMN_103035 [Dreissena polymorpha]